MKFYTVQNEGGSMRFIKEYVPDNRFQTGFRPLKVEGCFLTWLLWSLTKGIKKLAEHFITRYEAHFQEVVEKTEPIVKVDET